jgi:thiol-disulfide isomerase/thioredoxin
MTTRHSFRAIAAVLLGALLAGTSPAGIVNRAAPDFSLKSRAGQTVSLASLRGKVVLINFWATWCGPCRKEMPLLEQLSRKYEPLGFTVLGVNVEQDSRLADVFLKDVKVTFPILLDPANGVSKLYDVAAMPSTVIVDRRGNVRFVHQGYQPGDESRYQDVVRQLIREKA